MTPQALTTAGTPVLVVHSEDDSVIPVHAADEVVQALQKHQHPSTKYIRYKHAPGPPMPEYAHLIGHGSYELAFRSDDVYHWMLSHSCDTCAGLAAG